MTQKTTLEGNLNTQGKGQKAEGVQSIDSSHASFYFLAQQDITTGPTLRVDKFVIEQYLGSGGFGMVFRARDTLLQRTVALKVPHARVLEHAGQRDRFLREGQAAAQLSHPHLLPVFEAGDDRGLLYLAMTYCPGPTLLQWLQKHTGPLSQQLAVQLIHSLATALSHAHERGVIHLDLKPANILLMPCGEDAAAWAHEFPYIPCISDFGLAKVVEESWFLSGSSVIIGTPRYMAWEQAMGKSDQMGPHTDVYALGVMLYELLTSQIPYSGVSALGVLEMMQNEHPIPPRRHNPNITRDVETICLKCLARNPLQRYATAQELADDLQSAIDGKAIQARRAKWWESVARWCRRPERMRDAGVYAIVLNAIIILWVLMGFAQSPKNPELISALPSAIMILFATHLPMIGIGIFTIRRARWAIWSGLLIAIPLFLMVFINFLGYGNLFEVFWKDNLVRTNMFFLISLLFGIQLVTYGIAAWSSWYSRIDASSS
jgi:hypothetical protein